MKGMKGMKRKQLGQGMTEYIIIVALIAVSAITVYNLFGDTVRNQVGDMTAELGGGEAGGDSERATMVEGAKTEREADYSLKDFKQSD